MLVVRWSTLVSIMVCTSMLLVRDEKLTNSGDHLPTSKPAMKLRVVTVFAVPDSPTNRMGFFVSSILRRKNWLRAVSTVGTSTLLNSNGEGATYFAASHFIQCTGCDSVA